MTFGNVIGEKIVIDQATYTVAEHPPAPGKPYGQAGRQGIVFSTAGQPSD